MTLSSAQLEALVGYGFPGGTYRIARWENWLLTDCTDAEPLPDDLVHPIALFHVPILGSRTSIAELFQLFQAEGPGSVSLVSYDWEYLRPLREDVDYRCNGGIVAAARGENVNGRFSDTVSFQIDLSDESGEPAARITNTWRFHRKVA